MPTKTDRNSLNGRRQLRRLVVALEGGYALPPDLQAWLLAGLRRYLSNDAESLCRALELRPAGQRHPATLEAVNRRNRYLRAAARYITLNPDVGAWGRAKRLSALIGRYRPRSHAPQDQATLLVWKAYQTAVSYHIEIPNSPRHIYRIILGSDTN